MNKALKGGTSITIDDATVRWTFCQGVEGIRGDARIVIKSEQ